jgi:pyruvate dehydrogenase E2 component (dihydrolipoamide acetyltransferase)
VTHKVKVPQLSETMEHATILRWYKAAGDRVQKKENLYQVETDKATVDVESVDSGFLGVILAFEGEVVKVEQEIAVIVDVEEECHHLA